jgi:molecular chaperone DnaK
VADIDERKGRGIINAVGIDFGTAHLGIAVSGSDSHKVRRNEIAFAMQCRVGLALDGEIIIGDAAIEAAGPAIDRTIPGVLRRLDATWAVGLGTQRVIGVDIATRILSEARTTLDQRLRGAVGPAVIAVPPMLGAVARGRVRAAAENAGWEVLRLMNSTSAIASSWALKNGYAGTLTVVDLGAGTLDISRVEVADGPRIESAEVGGSIRLGGLEWDDAVRASLTKRFGSDALPEAPHEADRLCETMKIGIFTRGRHRVEAQARNSQALTLTAGDIAERHRQLLARVAASVRGRSFYEGFEPLVIVHGRGAKMPGFEELFANHLVLGPHFVRQPDAELVALGAALEAERLLGGEAGVRDQLCEGIALRIHTTDLPALERGVHLPASTHVEYWPPDRRRKLAVEVRQGNRRRLDRNPLINRFEVRSPLPPVLRFRVTADENGIVAMQLESDPPAKRADPAG